jgi:hypothetical protein
MLRFFYEYVLHCFVAPEKLTTGIEMENFFKEHYGCTAALKSWYITLFPFLDEGRVETIL